MICSTPHQRLRSKQKLRSKTAAYWRNFRGPADTAKAPSWSWSLLAACLLLQAGLSWIVPRAWQADTSPGAVPSIRSLSLWSLGEKALASYAMSLYIQTFDSQAGRSLRLRTLDQVALRSWLDQSITMNPDSAYALLLASRVYASATTGNDARKLLELVHQRFLEAPNQRWPWLAHAVHVARYELHDMALAKRFARSLAIHSVDDKVPSWARQLELVLLEANNETEAARRLLGGLITSGQIKNEAELRFLAERLKQLTIERGSGGDQRH